jgi:uncharacterized protein YuzE
MMRQSAYYDREAGIVYVTVLSRRRRKHRSLLARSDERGWGLIHYDTSGEVVGFEFWRPKEMLPADLLEAMPEPEFMRWERFRLRIRFGWDRTMWRRWRRRRHARRQEAVEVDGPHRWYRGLPPPPDDPAELEEYRRRHPDVNT